MLASCLLAASSLLAPGDAPKPKGPTPWRPGPAEVATLGTDLWDVRQETPLRPLGAAGDALLRELSCRQHACREAASEQLRHRLGRDVASARVLVAAEASRDPEARTRAHALLVEFFRCSHCQGLGEHDSGFLVRPCSACGGWGETSPR